MPFTQFSRKLIKVLFIPCILFVGFVFAYTTYQKNIPIAFWDEILWVRRSYFFDFFIRGDFKNNIWQTYPAYDQPKLAEYTYGAFLYPQYLRERHKTNQTYDYVQYLIQNGLYDVDEYGLSDYKQYLKSFPVISFDATMSGTSQEWVERYGAEGLKPINLVVTARILNIFLLAGAVVVGYFLALKFGGVFSAVLFSILYGCNTLLIETALRAHSEALFLFTFNAALFMMLLYFQKKEKLLYLVLFAILTGLSMSTKLNGGMLLLMFVSINIFTMMLKQKLVIKQALINLLPICISLSVFIFLNPYIYHDPLKNLPHMFRSRMDTAQLQSSDTAFHIERGFSVIKRVFSNFFFIDSQVYNGIEPLKKLTYSTPQYGLYLFVLFVVGAAIVFYKSVRGNAAAYVMSTSFLIMLSCMSYYLIINWGRYFAPLVLFFILFQSLGIVFLIKSASVFSKKLLSYVIHYVRKNEPPT